MIGGDTLCEKVGDFVHEAEFTESDEEFIRGNSTLRFEEGKPEDLGILSAELAAHFFCQVVVQNVFEVNIVEVISPRMEDLEALVLDALCTETFNVLNDETEFALVDVRGVG